MGVQLSGGGLKGGGEAHKWGNTVFEIVPWEAHHWPIRSPKIMIAHPGSTSSQFQSLLISVRVCQNPDRAKE